ncbi:YopX family protein [Paenibacillus spongiae]|uniref:YopX family protein n=1 Tax=Paenibacillus spongiae TaxID=2909671 RepID=A0ABY5SB89_9BACL|nr:YopX family protein [Paenibacillus spongiae]UVI31196.1 YopX family protein [Paenibacillus spongiae]
MSREIKFRGMDLQGRWFHGNLAILLKDLRSTGNKAGHYISNAAGAPFAYAVRPETVGQYTGLKDRNGVDVYEGDIAVGEHATYSIRWDDSKALFKARVEKTNTVLIRYNAFPLWQYLQDDGNCRFEIVGNIYNNPELIREEQ